MAQKIAFEDFLKDVHPALIPAVADMNEVLLHRGCKLEIKPAKSGYVASYISPGDKRTLFNYIFRKKGMMVRIYGDNINGYIDLFQHAPASVLSAIDKAGVCKRLIDPAKCNSRCPTGYDFMLNGKHYQKCRYGGLMFLLDDETTPFARAVIERELEARSAA